MSDNSSHTQNASHSTGLLRTSRLASQFSTLSSVTPSERIATGSLTDSMATPAPDVEYSTTLISSMDTPSLSPALIAVIATSGAILVILVGCALIFCICHYRRRAGSWSLRRSRTNNSTISDITSDGGRSYQNYYTKKDRGSLATGSATAVGTNNHSPSDRDSNEDILSLDNDNFLNSIENLTFNHYFPSGQYEPGKRGGPAPLPQPSSASDLRQRSNPAYAGTPVLSAARPPLERVSLNQNGTPASPGGRYDARFTVSVSADGSNV